MLQSKKINLLIAFIAAIALWFYVSGSISPDSTKKFKDIKVQLINQNSLIEEGFAVEKIEPATIDLTVIGSRSAINDIEESDIKVTADVYSRYKGRNFVNIDVELPKGVKIESKSADKILVEIDNLVTAEKTIEAVVDGELPEGTVLAQSDIEPKTVKVFGTKNNIAKILNVKATLDSSKLKQDKTSQTVKLLPVDQNGKEVDFISLSSDEAVVSANLEHFKKVPLKVNTIGESDNTNIDSVKAPEFIEIQGSEENLKGITSIKSSEIDLSDIKEASKIKINLDLPDGIKLKTGSEEPYLTVTMRTNSSAQFTLKSNDIDIKNLNNKYTAKVLTDGITVSVKSTDGKNVSLKKGDINLWIDLGKAVVGKSNHKVHVDEINGYSIEIKPTKVEVEVMEE